MLNGKVRCLKCEGKVFKEGNIYSFVNGYTELENGGCSLKYNSLEELNSMNRKSKFELVELPQPHKSLLKSGMKVEYLNGTKRFVLLETDGLHRDDDGRRTGGLYNYDDNLIPFSPQYTIMKIWDGETLIAERITKSKTQLEIERIEGEIKKLITDLKKLEGSC